MGALRRDAEFLTGQHIRGRVETADISGTGAPDCGIRFLCAACSELQQRVVRGHLLDPRRLGSDQRLIVHEVKDRSLDQLRLHNCAFDPDQRLIREYQGPFLHGMETALEMELQQLLQEGRRIILLLFRQVADILFREPQLRDVLGNPLQPGEHSEPVAERQPAEVSFEYCPAFVCAIHPVGIHHINLVFVCM